MKRLALLCLTFSSILLADTSQEGSLNTNNEDSTVNSHNATQSETNNYNGAGSSSNIPPPSAISPSYMSNGIETCLQGAGGSISTSMLGLSGGKYIEDPQCNRRRDAKVLSDLGMKVAAVARMCENIKVWRSMFVSGTPCPVLSKGKLIVGKRAYLMMKADPELYIPDYGKIKNKKVERRSCEHKGNYYKCNITPKTVEKPDFTPQQLWYNQILGIGESQVEQEDSGDSMSISERFRTAK